jgi:hypothetical protein
MNIYFFLTACYNTQISGRLAQLVEQRFYTAKVTGSSPVSPTNKKYPDEYLGFFYFVGDYNGGLESLQKNWVGTRFF